MFSTLQGDGVTVEAGWYADPADSAWVRWWDGAAWSSDAHPAAPVATPPVAPAPVTAPLVEAVVTASAPLAQAAPTAVAAPSITLAPVAAAPTVAVLDPPVLAAPVRLAPLEPAPVALAPLAPPARTATPLLEPLSVAEPALLGGVTSPVVVATRPEPVRALATPATAPATAPHRPPVAPADEPRPEPVASSTYASSGWDAGIATAGGGGGVGGSRFSSGGSGGGASGFGPMRPGASLSAPVVALPNSGTGKVIKRAIAGVVVLALLVAGVVVLVLPRVRDKQAVDAAAAAPSVLPHAAPRSLAGQKTVSLPGLSPAASIATVKAKGSTWAWAAGYGKNSEYTYYLAGDVPPDTRAEAMKAQTDSAAATRLLDSVTTSMGIAATGKPTTSVAREYGSSVGGKAWCMPVALGGNGGGYCLWTNGKEFLEVLNFPSVQEMSAKHTLAALTQLAALTTKATGAKPAK